MSNPTEKYGTDDGDELESGLTVLTPTDDSEDPEVKGDDDIVMIEAQQQVQSPSTTTTTTTTMTRAPKGWMRNTSFWTFIAVLTVVVFLPLLIAFNPIKTNPTSPKRKNRNKSNPSSSSKPSDSATAVGIPTTTTTTTTTILQGCIFGDRFDNEHNFQNNRLYPGQYICSDKKSELHRYRFGLTLDGDLVLQDTLNPYSDYNQILYENLDATTTPPNNDYYFSLQTNGRFVIHNRDSNNMANGTSKQEEDYWMVVPNRPMHLYEECLVDHDCPYLHLHQGGVLVVNYIDDTNEWQSKNSLKVYGYKGKNNNKARQDGYYRV